MKLYTGAGILLRIVSNSTAVTHLETKRTFLYNTHSMSEVMFCYVFSSNDLNGHCPQPLQLISLESADALEENKLKQLKPSTLHVGRVLNIILYCFLEQPCQIILEESLTFPT